jgi:hypothetical protein
MFGLDRPIVAGCQPTFGREHLAPLAPEFRNHSGYVRAVGSNRKVTRRADIQLKAAIFADFLPRQSDAAVASRPEIHRTLLQKIPGVTPRYPTIEISALRGLANGNGGLTISNVPAIACQSAISLCRLTVVQKYCDGL